MPHLLHEKFFGLNVCRRLLSAFQLREVYFFTKLKYNKNAVVKDECMFVLLLLSEAHAGLREEEESRRSVGDGFHVVLIVTAKEARQQVVEDAHSAHEGQEEEDAFSKQVAWGAAEKQHIQ